MAIDEYVSGEVESSSVEWYDDTSPRLSIVILNYNKSELTLDCLEHIWKHTEGVSYEIIVVDNGSRAEEFWKLARNPGRYRLIRLAQNRFYGEGNNIGVECAKGELVCLLNNDAFVTENWIGPLCTVLDTAWAAGAVGPRFVYPDGRLQELGAFIDSEGHAHQVGKLTLYNEEDIKTVRIVDYCSAACLLLRRSDFIKLAGFNLTYEPAYYEDVDLCFKLREAGLLVYCCPETSIVHIENATTATHRDVLGERTVDQNRLKFVSRWGKYLTRRHSGEIFPKSGSAPENPHPGEDPHAWSGERLRIAFYTPYDLTPGGGERYLLSAASAVRAIGDVVIVTENPYSQIRLASLSSELDIDLSGIRIVSRANLVDILPVEISVIMSNEVLPPIRGFGRYNYYLCQFPFPMDEAELAYRWPNIGSISEFICYSDFVKEHIGKEYGKISRDRKPINVLSPPVPQFNVGGTLVPPAAPIKILTIGRFFVGGHNKRHDVPIAAVRELLKSSEDVELHLVGSISAGHPAHARHLTDLKESAKGLPIHFHVNASIDQITKLMSECVLYIHAAGFGLDVSEEPQHCEHFGISVLEAMSAGCIPFVVDNGGPAEFVQNDVNGFTYSSMQELVDGLAYAIRGSENLTQLRLNARATAAKFSQDTFDRNWVNLVTPHITTAARP